MKLSDYVAQFLKKQGIDHVFGLTGGAVVHLFDSVARTRGMRPIFNHHEQAAALAAQAYARVRNKLAAAFVTTGPGGTNAITGVCAAWFDSVPCLYISGQARIEHSSRGKSVRQIGTQEFDIVTLVSSITKYAVMVDDPLKIKYYLQKAVHSATSGRPGPVWVDIPLNFQWAEIKPNELMSFDAASESDQRQNRAAINDTLAPCLDRMRNANRPLILAGYGVRLAHAETEFKALIQKIKWPFVSSWNASDILPTDHPLYVGRPGIAGQRGANLAVQNCDLLLSLGSHLSIPLTGTQPNTFARGAKKIVVDIDPAELALRNADIDLAVACDVKIFLRELLKRLPRPVPIQTWQKQCSRYKGKYNGVDPKWRRQKKFVNPYVFIDALSDELGTGDAVVVDGGGTVVYTAFQALKVKTGQRLVISSGLCAMGTGLPESVGACFANGGRRVICLCGDGSAQLNIQELQTIVHHRLPIKIFIFNNGGYLSIRHTQREFLEKRYIGANSKGGLSLPDWLKIAKAYGVKTLRITGQEKLRGRIRAALGERGPVVCELMISRKQEVTPRIGFDKKPDGTYAPRPMEDMYPYLNRKEFADNMVKDGAP